MNTWEDDGIVLGARPHGENGLIVTLLTEGQGRAVGYVPGGQSRSKRAFIEPGAQVHAQWQARVLDQMGTFTLEPIAQVAGLIMDDGVKLAALLSACALCDTALPEREAHPALYHGFRALLDQLPTDLWGVSYVAWEIALMKELGFALDLSRCAGGGDPGNLYYMSPKSGVAVSYDMGVIYKAKLLPLPHFLRPVPDLDVLGDIDDVVTGLRMTGYFLEHWVYNHHRSGVPDARAQLLSRAERLAGQCAEPTEGSRCGIVV